MAPSTPPPPKSDEFAAFTSASVSSRVMSAGPWNSMVLPPSSRIRIAKLCTLSPGRSALLGESFHSRQLLAFEELERRAAAGRDVCDLVRDASCIDGCHRVAAAHDRGCARVLCDGIGNFESTLSKRCNLENAHRAVPDDGARPEDFFDKQFDCRGADVERHHIRRNGLSAVYCLHRRVGINFVGHDVVNG